VSLSSRKISPFVCFCFTLYCRIQSWFTSLFSSSTSSFSITSWVFLLLWNLALPLNEYPYYFFFSSYFGHLVTKHNGSSSKLSFFIQLSTSERHIFVWIGGLYFFQETSGKRTTNPFDLSDLWMTLP